MFLLYMFLSHIKVPVMMNQEIVN